MTDEIDFDSYFLSDPDLMANLRAVNLMLGTAQKKDIPSWFGHQNTGVIPIVSAKPLSHTGEYPRPRTLTANEINALRAPALQPPAAPARMTAPPAAPPPVSPAAPVWDEADAAADDLMRSLAAPKKTAPAPYIVQSMAKPAGSSREIKAIHTFRHTRDLPKVEAQPAPAAVIAPVAVPAPAPAQPAAPIAVAAPIQVAMPAPIQVPMPAPVATPVQPALAAPAPIAAPAKQVAPPPAPELVAKSADRPLDTASEAAGEKPAKKSKINVPHIGNTPAKVIRGVFSLVFYALIAVVMVCAVIFFVNQSPSKTLFGYRFYNTLTRSMDAGKPGDFKIGDLVFTKEVAPADVKVGDIVTYKVGADGKTYLTHRVVEIKPTMMTSGQTMQGPFFVTKGDANDTPDPPFSGDRILGVKVFSIPMLGGITTFIQQNVFLVIGLILLAFALITVIRMFFNRDKGEGDDTDDDSEKPTSKGKKVKALAF